MSFVFTAVSVRNGPVAGMLPATVRRSLPAEYCWVRVTVSADTTDEVMLRAYVDVVVRQMNGTLPAAPTPANLRALRRTAVILGTARFGISKAWGGINVADVHERERAPWSLAINPANALQVPPDAPPKNAAFGPATELIVLDEDDLEVAGYVAKLGYAAPVLVGYSLSLTGHHYVDEVRRAFQAVETQVLRGRGEGILATYCEGFEWRDLVWHKAAHPISSQGMQMLANSPDVKARYEAAKLGSAVVRVPALGAEASRASSALAILSQVRPIYERLGATVTTATLEARLRDLQEAKRAQYSANPPADAADVVRLAVAALSAQLELLRPDVATAFCTLQALAADLPGPMAHHSLLRSYFGRKSATEMMAAGALGEAYARQYRASLRADVEAGILRPTDIQA